jgi:hypothetical protein
MASLGQMSSSPLKRGVSNSMEKGSFMSTYSRQGTSVGFHRKFNQILYDKDLETKKFDKEPLQFPHTARESMLEYASNTELPLTYQTPLYLEHFNFTADQDDELAKIKRREMDHNTKDVQT